VVRRWQFDSGQPGCGRRVKKSCQRHSEEPQDHALGRSRGGFGSKLHLVTDGTGLPLAVEVSPGEVHESTRLESLMNLVRVPQPVGRPRTRPFALAGDKAYSCRRIREWLSQHKITPVIPRRENEARDERMKFDKDSYRKRSIIEQCIGWLKECRRIGTRFEKLAINFLAMIKLAFIDRYMKTAFSDRA
jgi:transposase